MKSQKKKNTKCNDENENNNTTNINDTNDNTNTHINTVVNANTNANTTANTNMDFINGNLYINFNSLNELFNIPGCKNKNETCDVIPIYFSDEYKLLKKKKILVISGGGIRGMSFIGALKALDNYKILNDIDTFVGTSVGALIILFYVIGYTIDEIFEFIKYFDVTKMSSIDNLHTIITSYGFDNGKKIEIILTKIFQSKNINPEITFNELFIMTKKEIIVTSVCVNNMNAVYMSHKSHPNMSVHLAIRMSISIPILFTPILFENKYYIDGGCIDNYPIGLFKDKLDDVIGLYVETNNRTVENIDTIEDYIYQLLQCISKGLSNNILNGYEKSTISISIDWIPLIDINMDIDDKIKLFSRGYEVTYDYIINNIFK